MMLLLGLTLQTLGKLIKRRYVGSQLSIDYTSNYYHIAHLEEFTTLEIIKVKKSYKK